MVRFNPFNKPVAALKRTGLIGHWKKSDAHEPHQLREIIGLLQDGDVVTIVYTFEHAHRAAVAMLHLNHTLRLAKKSLIVFARGLLWQDTLAADVQHPTRRTSYEATVVNLNGTTKHRKKIEQHLFDELHKNVIEFQVIRGEKNPI